MRKKGYRFNPSRKKHLPASFLRRRLMSTIGCRLQQTAGWYLLQAVFVCRRLIALSTRSRLQPLRGYTACSFAPPLGSFVLPRFEIQFPILFLKTNFSHFR